MLKPAQMQAAQCVSKQALTTSGGLNIRQNRFDVIPYPGVGKPEHQVSYGFQLAISLLIICVADVGRPISFDDQSCLDAKKVGDVALNWNLPAELQAGQFPVAQARSEQSLVGGWPGAHGLRAIAGLYGEHSASIS